MNILILAIIALVTFVLVFYNVIIFRRNITDKAWAHIDVQLKRRHDLIPNIVKTAKAFIAHEVQTLESITKARAKAVLARNPKDIQTTENALTQSLSNFLMVVEDYPHLKANRNMLNLHEELITTENRIALSRQFYNDQVTKYNTLIRLIPVNIISFIFAFKKKDLFEIENIVYKDLPPVII